MLGLFWKTSGCNLGAYRLELEEVRAPGTRWSSSQFRLASGQVLPFLPGEGDISIALNPENLVAIGDLVRVDTLSLERDLVLLVVAGTERLVDKTDEDGNSVLGKFGSAVSITRTQDQSRSVGKHHYRRIHSPRAGGITYRKKPA